MSPRQALHIIGTTELATLFLMLLNVITVHHPTITSLLGPMSLPRWSVILPSRTDFTGGVVSCATPWTAFQGT